ncbi:RsmD family RNA methyltransferase [Candidatus Saccharibacteria bacterium]|nr:RsmD family RNA methyltransferase [Candidatus Saccharibacteria bacterium]
MRVISGNLGGRFFESPHGHKTHPMSEKIRGAIFNMLGDIKGLSFFDAFSGTGALAIEAVSRGAGHVTAVELNIESFKTIIINFETLGITDVVDPIRKDVKAWSRNHKDVQFDVVLCDPPYDAVAYTLLHKLASHAKPGGLIIYSLPPGNDFKLDTDTYESVSEKSYGDANLSVYRRIV